MLSAHDSCSNVVHTSPSSHEAAGGIDNVGTTFNTALSALKQLRLGKKDAATLSPFGDTNVAQLRSALATATAPVPGGWVLHSRYVMGADGQLHHGLAVIASLQAFFTASSSMPLSSCSSGHLP